MGFWRTHASAGGPLVLSAGFGLKLSFYLRSRPEIADMRRAVVFNTYGHNCLDSQFRFGGPELRHGEFQILLGMQGAQLDPNARLAHGHHRE